MANQLIGLPTSFSQMLADQLEKRRQEKMSMAQAMINSGQYQPSIANRMPGVSGLINSALSGVTGPNVGSPSMNVSGQQFQFQTPEMKAKALQDQLKAYSSINSPQSSGNMPGSPSSGVPTLPQVQIEPSIDPSTGQVSPKITYTTPLQQADYASKMLDVQKKQQELKDANQSSQVMNMTPEQARADLQKKNPAYANYLKALAEGKMQMGGRSTGKMMQVQKDLASYYPDIDQSKIQTRYSTRRDFTTGTAAKNIKAANTAVNHMNELNNQIDKLHNSGFKLWNMFGQTMNRQFAGNSPTAQAMARFKAIKTALDGELATLMKNGMATDAEIKRFDDSLDSADAPDSMKASLNEFMNLMGGRLSALQDQWHNAFDQPGDPDFPVISKTSQKVLKSIGYDTTNNSNENTKDNQGNFQTFNVRGKTYKIPSDSVDEFKKDMGL